MEGDQITKYNSGPYMINGIKINENDYEQVEVNVKSIDTTNVKFIDCELSNNPDTNGFYSMKSDQLKIKFETYNKNYISPSICNGNIDVYAVATI